MAKKKPTTGEPNETADALSALNLGLDDAPPKSSPAAPTDDAPPESVEREPEPAPEAEPAPEPVTHQGVTWLKSQGYEVPDDATDDDVRSNIDEWHEKAQQAERLEQEIQRLTGLLQQKPEAPPKTEAEPPPKAADEIPQRPQLDDTTEAFLQFAHQRGLVTTSAGGLAATDEPSLRQHVDKYNQWLIESRKYDREWTAERITEVKVQKLLTEREAEIEKRLLEKVGGTLQQDRTQSEIDRYFEQHKAAYFDLNPDGQPVWDAQRQTWSGQRYAAYMDAVREAQEEFGITEPSKLFKYAARKVPPVVQEPAPKDTPATRTAKFRNRLKSNNGADSPLPTAPVNRPSAKSAALNNKHLTYDQKLTRHFEDLMSEKVADRL